MIEIGNWVRRLHGKWHLVESVIDEDPITKCGRRLRGPRTVLVSEVEPLTRMIGQPQNCKRCQ